MTTTTLAALVLMLLQAGAFPASPSQAPALSNLAKLVDEAKTDLAERLSASASDVSLVRSRSVVWSNGSLGCPEPGMAYAEVLTPGYLIVLKARDREYEYHSARSGSVVYCKNPAPPSAAEPDDI